MHSSLRDGGLRSHRRAFTLIELLVVLAIIGVLAALVTPAITRALSSGKGAGCASNARQIALAMVAFDGDNQQLPWRHEGEYVGQFDSGGSMTNSQLRGTNWTDKLVIFKYLPSYKDKGVWLCPGAARSEVYGKDQNKNPANFGGYGVCNNILRMENTLNSSGGAGNINVPQRPLKLKAIPRPANIWCVGDCGRPVSKSVPGSGFYQRTASEFGRPSTVGAWDFTKAYTDPSPAMRHNGEVCWAAFDTHVSRMNWDDLRNETNNFTARSESF